MKRMRVLLGSVALVASTALITTEVVSARQDARQEEPSAAAMQEMMARMMELGTPGPEHEALAALVGKWTQSYRMKLDPRQPDWQESTGTSEVEMILDGRFAVQTYELSAGGIPMKGYQILGFDKLKGEYTSLWADTFSTWWISSTGVEISPGTIEMKGTMVDVAGERPFRSIIQLEGPRRDDGPDVRHHPGPGRSADDGVHREARAVGRVLPVLEQAAPRSRTAAARISRPAWSADERPTSRELSRALRRTSLERAHPRARRSDRR